jgi:tetratricopeptide (TPR) repeat protein
MTLAKSVCKWVLVGLGCIGGAAVVAPVRAQVNGGGGSGAVSPNKATATQGPGAGATGAAAGAARAKASLEPLLKQASEALIGGEIAAAREAFLDAFTLDPRSAKAAHGLALCYLYSNQTKKAAQTFDKAVVLAGKPDRALVLNAAAAHIADRNNARAAKLLKDYLTANPRELDEPMVNALGTALMAASPQERKNRLFSEAASFYETVNKKLEAARPGSKRFGMEWLPATQADAKHRTLAGQQRKIETLEEAVANAEEMLVPALKEFERQKDLIRRGEPPGNYYYRSAETAYNSAVARHEAAIEALEKGLAEIERPRFPEAIALVSIDDVKTPELSPSAGVTVASADTGTFTVTKRGTRAKEGGGETPGRMTLGTGKGAGNTNKGGGTSDTTAGGGGNANNPLGGPTVVYEPPKPARKVRVTQYAAAFPVAPDLAVTSAAAVDDNATLQLQLSDGQSIKASLVRKDDETGLALIRIEGKKLIPLALADSFGGGTIACASFPTVDLFNPAGQKIAGNAPAPKDGADWTVSLNLHPRLAGSPILSGSKVVGVCIAPRDAEKTKLPAVALAALKQFLGEDAKPAAAPGDPMSNLLQLVSTRESGE